jgi:hypothetical protein
MRGSPVRDRPAASELAPETKGRLERGGPQESYRFYIKLVFPGTSVVAGFVTLVCTAMLGG